MVESTEHLGVLAEVEAGEVEEREQVVVPDVEEEVCGALVLAVLEQLGERAMCSGRCDVPMLRLWFPIGSARR